ncbi:MAG: DNA polymerase III subunit alpha [Chitinophagaceae bacterium]|nr:MAG: DNA polymerase III subunit alpha [Chitinophagaceae bacterium]
MYLNCKTWFSYRYGTFPTEDLVKYAAEAGAVSLALTNINNTADAWDFVDFCREAGIKPVLGAEIRNDHVLCYILLAKNDAGFLSINRFLSEHLMQKTPFPEKPSLDKNVWVIYPFGKISPDKLQDNELIGVQPAEVNKLYKTDVKKYAAHFVIRHPVTFKDKRGYNIHRLLRAIDKNILLSRQSHDDLAGEQEYLMPVSELLNTFIRYPGIVSNTLHVTDACETRMELFADKNKKYFSGTEKEDADLLEHLASEGLQKRYGLQNDAAGKRVEKELGIIYQMHFTAYFLIIWDIVRYAKGRGFFYVGRGSGANSIVAYCLGITDVDPIGLDLYFERFLNPNRSSPPDFDMDFSWADRDEIINYVFNKYGKEHVSLLGMFSTFQQHAVIRELGKVFGLPKDEIDQISDHPQMATDKWQQQIIRYGNLIKDFPNHLSIHAGGMLISEKPIYQYTATELPPKGFATSQIDMFLAEKTGLFKLDILSQRGLGHIKDTIELVKETQEADINIREVDKFMQDKKLAEKIRTADTIGCFYIESPAMRQLLKKLECDDYLTLVAASSIIRPGVAQSGMMRQYIYYYHHPDEVVYLHPIMKELMEETFGVMVYQEDVIKVAHHFAGLDMADADVLRRAMSGKYRSNNRFQLIKEQFFANCKQKGYSDKLTAEVWRQMESFGGYSFSKAHSASYAVESYQSLFLKTYYPVEFLVSVINNFGGFYNTELYFHQLKRTGVPVLAPCVNNSNYLTCIREKKVYVGFVHILDLEKNTAEYIIKERKQNGHYLHLTDFIERTNITLEPLNILIKTGALRFTGKPKKRLLWEANFLQKKNKQHVPAHQSLFEEKPMTFTLPLLPQHPLEDALQEMQLLGFPLCDVFRLVDDDPAKYISAKDLPLYKGKQVTVLGYYVTEKHARTIKGESMFFGTFLDAEGNWIDTVHFPDAARRDPLQGKGFYRLAGKVSEEFGVYSIDVYQSEKVGIKSIR